MMRNITSLIFLIWTILGLAIPASANPIQTELSRVSLVSEVRSIAPGSTFWVALRWQMRPKWHIYWQNPGDSGARPTLTWQLPAGFTAGDVLFPNPQRFLIPPVPLANFGYENEVYLPVVVRSPASITQRSVDLNVRIDWLICEQECIPESGELSLSLPVGDGQIGDGERALFQEIRQTLPQSLPAPLSFQITEQELLLDLGALPEFGKSSPTPEVTFFPAQDGLIVNAAPQKLEFMDDRPVLRLQRGYQTEVPALGGVLVENRQRGWSLTANPVALATSNAVKANPETTSFIEAMGLAIAGGIVLNLMPCVLPILSLRALSIVALSQQSARTARLSGLAFTGGVMTCFGAIAGALLVLRSLGQAVGWGFQLQSPGVVLTLTYLMFGVGLNLSGVFVIGGGLMGIGQRLTTQSGLTGEFFSGVLAVLMSTPCSAPFMATAVSAALVLPELQSLLILLTLGLGFALPYLGLCFVPALQRVLPKPGPWLEVFPQVLAFPIYGTAGWLLWVYHLQAGSDGLAIALVGLVLIGFASWLYGKTQAARSFWRRIGLAGTGLSLALCLMLFPWGNPSSERAITWQPYSQERLTALRAAGKPVFVNFTAAWCVSCLLNERTTLSLPEIQSEFQKRNIELLKADWTNQDQEITKALRMFGSSGVPLYLLYGAKIGGGEPQVLPKTLTPQVVRDALEQITPLS
ncbi:MAG: thiol:disulfide interchange protein [Oscillatoriales cyanobacterium SM2_2_1]|nr:thiol:disulfide interchange protein [Oscillatoriales cyanobacterium SM2_2_1]